MRTPRAPFFVVPALLLAASCGGESTTPSIGTPPALTSEPGPVGPVLPSAPSVAPEDARSLIDTLSVQERFAREVDQVDDAQLMASMMVGQHRAHFVNGFPGLVEFVILNTGSGWQEKFLLQLPPTMPTGPVPLLVVFHKFGSSHGDVLNTTFFAETQARGWYGMAPLGARQKHFGNNESQINTRAALNLVARLFPVDRQRVYGVGFSMGGGAMANYAARHVDPRGIRFAALVDHTGGVSLSHTWFYEPDDADLDDNTPTPGANLEVPDILESYFGGTPAASPFQYQRCSLIDLDPTFGTINPTTNFARNLKSIPTHIWIANADPMAYLVTQTSAFDGHLQAQGVDHQYTSPPGNTHVWATVDETAACDWLQTKTLQTPTSQSTLADEDGRWYHFDVEQQATGAFTPFTWDVNAAARRVTISGTRNMKRVSIDSTSAGFALTGNVTLRVSTADGTGDRVRLLNVSAAPLGVTRDGLAASGTFDSLTQTFEIVETSSTLHEWVITFL